MSFSGNACGGSARGGDADGGGATGGNATGGNATGGGAFGGNAFGGSATGGNATGGNATGGNATGGSAYSPSTPSGGSLSPLPPVRYLRLWGNLNLETELTSGGAIKIYSSSINLSRPREFDSTDVRFMSDSDMLFRVGIRIWDNKLAFNTKLGGDWGKRIELPLANWFRKSNATLVVHDHGNVFELTIDGKYVYAFPKRSKKNVKSIRYETWESSHNPCLERTLEVSYYTNTSLWAEI
ncbi:hypothetical protein BDW59DRAFT_161333 [Aspergillus cavernicola]|uniref:Galectin domain-containing protein n=1 Tax=Aspergillus cavernicola TaxID=176166 RepID=A0ABR4IDZ1_9EURO